MKFGILGYGFVGKATVLGLRLPNDTIIHDLNLNTNRSILDDADVVFVCIPTNTQTDVNILISEIEQLKADTVISFRKLTSVCYQVLLHVFHY